MALLTALLFLPFLLFALPAGVWVDRLARRPILVIADLVRAVALASIPLAYALDVLTMWQLYVVGFVVGIGTVFFDVAYQSYLPSLVGRDQLVDGNSKLMLSYSSSQVAGPGVAGVLIGLLGAAAAVLVDAVSFVASALFLARIKTREELPPQAERRPMRAELMEGFRFLLAESRIRAIAASTMLFNFFSNVTFSIFLVYAVRVLDLGAGTIGILFALGNIGGVAAAVFGSRISARLGVGPTMILGASTSLAMILVPLAPVSQPVPFLLASLLRDELRRRRLQRHRHQLPAGDHARPDAGPPERLAPLPRVGRDPARQPGRRHPREHDRAAPDALRRRDRDHARGRCRSSSRRSARSAPVSRRRAPPRAARRRSTARRGRARPEPRERCAHLGQPIGFACELLEPRGRAQRGRSHRRGRPRPR